MVKSTEMKAALAVLVGHKLSLDYAALPTKCEVFAICGGQAAEMRDAIEALEPALDLIEAQAKEIAELKEALKVFATVGALIERYFPGQEDGAVFRSGCAWTDATGATCTLTLGDFRKARRLLSPSDSGRAGT